MKYLKNKIIIFSTALLITTFFSCTENEILSPVNDSITEQQHIDLLLADELFHAYALDIHTYALTVKREIDAGVDPFLAHEKHLGTFIFSNPKKDVLEAKYPNFQDLAIKVVDSGKLRQKIQLKQEASTLPYFDCFLGCYISYSFCMEAAKKNGSKQQEILCERVGNKCMNDCVSE